MSWLRARRDAAVDAVIELVAVSVALKSTAVLASMPLAAIPLVLAAIDLVLRRCAAQPLRCGSSMAPGRR